MYRYFVYIQLSYVSMAYNFISIDNNNTKEVHSLSRDELFNLFPAIRSRDIHIIDQRLQYRNSNIILKDDLILIKLHYIRCVIIPTKVYIESIDDNLYKPQINDLCNALSKTLQNGKTSYPFEHIVLEMIFMNVKEYFDKLITETIIPKVSKIHNDVENNDDAIDKIVADRDYVRINKLLITLKSKVDEKGVTMIPLSLYLKKNLVKLEFGLAKGKKLWDKRKSKMEKDVSRQIDRELKKARN